jgi:hypothetical protein
LASFDASKAPHGYSCEIRTFKNPIDSAGMS